jgi:hypothetical protein
MSGVEDKQERIRTKLIALCSDFFYAPPPHLKATGLHGHWDQLAVYTL